MTRKRIFRLCLAGVALAAGLGVAAYLSAGNTDKLRPRAVPYRAAFTAPLAEAGRPAPVHYQAQIRDLTGGDEEIISPVPFTLVSGPVDSHVVWLVLDINHNNLVRVRGVAANGAVGLWSNWSDRYGESPWGLPDPPDD